MWQKVAWAWVFATAFLALQTPASGQMMQQRLPHWAENAGFYMIPAVRQPFLQDDYFEEAWRPKRVGSPSLSVTNPIDVLRNRLILEAARRTVQKQNKHHDSSHSFLKTIGKRQVFHPRAMDKLESADYMNVNGEVAEWETS